jgi:hypothetical protein
MPISIIVGCLVALVGSDEAKNSPFLPKLDNFEVNFGVMAESNGLDVVEYVRVKKNFVANALE